MSRSRANLREMPTFLEGLGLCRKVAAVVARRRRSSRKSFARLARRACASIWEALKAPWRRRWIRLSALVAVGLLMALNLSVRALGGDVHPLSLGRVGERAQALLLFAAHQLRCRDGEGEAAELVRAAALRHHVSTRLAVSVARTESSLIHTRISSTGAMGLMQLMPATARELGVSDPFDARENADGGVRYLAQLLANYRGDARKAVAAYNAGSARVPLAGRANTWPAETRNYVARVLSGM